MKNQEIKDELEKAAFFAPFAYLAAGPAGLLVHAAYKLFRIGNAEAKARAQQEYFAQIDRDVVKYNKRMADAMPSAEAISFIVDIALGLKHREKGETTHETNLKKFNGHCWCSYTTRNNIHYYIINNGFSFLEDTTEIIGVDEFGKNIYNVKGYYEDNPEHLVNAVFVRWQLWYDKYKKYIAEGRNIDLCCARVRHFGNAKLKFDGITESAAIMVVDDKEFYIAYRNRF